MKRQLRAHLAAMCLLAPAAFTLTALPTTAAARPATPEVSSLEVASDNGVNPGSRLQFTLQGTPGARASVRIRGVRDPIPLRETARGVYRGQYIVGRADDIDTGDKIRAILRHGNRTVTASYDVPPGLRTVAVAPPPLRIERFQVSTLERVEPGADIDFMLEGAPGAVAVVDLPGIANNVQLREVRPGHYEGSYTIRRADRLDPNGPVVATLRAGNRAVTANLNHPLVVADNRRQEADNRAPVLRDLTPREGDVVPGGPNTVVSGQFGDRGGSGVDPNSVRIMVSGRNVTQDAEINPRSFTYRAPLPPGRHTVDVTARDRAGNTLRRSWSFEVAAAAPANVPIQILSHTNNGQVDGNVARVRGRTAPNATVDVRVDAVPPVVGQFGVAQQLLSRTIQADRNGDFEFSFTSPFPVPGTRYDVQMVAHKADVTNEARITLFQRQG
ncbi:hypothetical protein [Ramlibacter sp.]|uniref:hypothetical protein n=1 Tax=Ramlibacter sp. TaxID=1917967 RepID=UPI002BCFF257|nr:hypothetical protein [Ramlibacter sp.]HWI81596.1 hypothetical protein [Ramlibacter sp.]